MMDLLVSIVANVSSFVNRYLVALALSAATSA
jgi:hypothetical protein